MKTISPSEMSLCQDEILSNPSESTSPDPPDLGSLEDVEECRQTTRRKGGATLKVPNALALGHLRLVKQLARECPQ